MRKLGLLIFTLLWIALPVLAGDTGALTGRVVTQDDQPVLRAQVVLSSYQPGRDPCGGGNGGGCGGGRGGGGGGGGGSGGGGSGGGEDDEGGGGSGGGEENGGGCGGGDRGGGCGGNGGGCGGGGCGGGCGDGCGCGGDCGEGCDCGCGGDCGRGGGCGGGCGRGGSGGGCGGGGCGGDCGDGCDCGCGGGTGGGCGGGDCGRSGDCEEGGGRGEGCGCGGCGPCGYQVGVSLPGITQRFETSTDASGGFTFDSIPAGMYELTVQSGAVRKSLVTRIAANGATNLDVVLDGPMSAGDPVAPGSFALMQLYPNPFNSSLNISVGVRSTGMASINIYDAAGRFQTTLFNGTLEPGIRTFRLDGASLATGLYMIGFVSGEGRFLQTAYLVR